MNAYKRLWRAAFYHDDVEVRFMVRMFLLIAHGALLALLVIVLGRLA